MKKNKKGFTIVELVIVIAVIAILAAVLIPTFVGLIDKANISADQQAVRSMNTALTAESVTEKPENANDVRRYLAANGFNNAMETTYKKYVYGWLKDENVIVLVENGNIVYPEAYKTADNSETNLFFFNVKFVKDADALLTAIENVGNTEASAIVLSSDMNMTSVAEIAVEENKEVEIDLNGKTIKAPALDKQLFNVTKNGMVEIYGGKIETNKDLVYAHDSSTIVLKDLDVKSTDSTKYLIGTNGNDGHNVTIIVENCTFDAKNVLYIPTGKVILKNSTFIGRSNICGGDVTIDNCTFISTGSTIAKDYLNYSDKFPTWMDGESGHKTAGEALLVILNIAEGSRIIQNLTITNSTFKMADDVAENDQSYGLRVYNHLKATNSVEKSIVKLNNNTYENYVNCPENLKGKAVYLEKNGTPTEF